MPNLTASPMLAATAVIIPTRKAPVTTWMSRCFTWNTPPTQMPATTK